MNLEFCRRSALCMLVVCLTYGTAVKAKTDATDIKVERGSAIEKTMKMAAKSPSATKPKLPKGWFMSGETPDAYEASIDTSNSHGGSKSAHLKHAGNMRDGSEWCTLMQNVGTEKYLDKRLRVTFWVKTKNVEGWVQPWMRIDGKDTHAGSLAFDNMCKRSIKGTTDWTKYAIVLDVPPESSNIAFGVMLGGKGELWFDDVSFDVVGKDIPVTDCPCSRNNEIVKEPENLNFEQGEED